MVLVTLIVSSITGVVFGIGGYYYGKHREKRTYLDEQYEKFIKTYENDLSDDDYHPIDY
jgi:hypothetical protein